MSARDAEAVGGDPAALCRIYGKYRDGLLKVAAALLNDRSGVEDIVHDVFLAFVPSPERLRLAGRLRSYLTTCVANLAREWSPSGEAGEIARLPASTAG